MRRIIIKSITLRNWRGEKERTTTFHMDAPTYICGDNGLGKSRHFDAFCWLLFGKDSQNRADYELRTYDTQHNPLHHCECSVEATLAIDGEPLTIKREWCEKWVKPRGQVEEVFKGNEAQFTWNGVPVNKTEFNKRVKEVIIDDSLFRLITNPHYFPVTMTWQQQREALLQMAGTASDYEVAADNADFKALLDELNGKSLSDFRKEIAATKKRLKEELDKIPTRIDEVQRNTPESEDWEEISKGIQQKKNDIDDIDRQLQDSDARNEAQRKERDNINKAIDEALARQRAIVRQADNDEIARCDKANERRRELEARLKKAHIELTDATIDVKRNNCRIADLQREVEDADKLLEELRKEWYGINASAYDGSSDTCPCCGQRLPEERIAEAHRLFDEKKKSGLSANNTKGKLIAAQKASYQKEIEERQAENETLERRIASANDEIKTLTEAVLATPAATVAPVNAEDIPEWVAEKQKIETLRTQLNDLRGKAGMDDGTIFLKENKKRLQNELEVLQMLLSKRGQIEQAGRRIEELRRRGRELAQQIADIEKREYVAAQFSKKKIEDCEQRINGMFRQVRFKLFDCTQDGNEYECCVPLVGGVPYPVANTASQINAGLDIINTLCKFHNVSAPIFIDGAERVNSYTETPSQMIFLQVTNDKQLTIR